MIASSIGLSLIAIVVNLIITGLSVDKDSGVWAVIVILPTIGLPIGFILIIVLLVLSMISRSRAAKDAGN